MRKFLLFPLLLFMTAIIVSACSDDEEDIFPPETNDTIGGGDTLNILDTISVNKHRKFNGTLVVNGTYVQDGTDCEIILEKAPEKVTLNINNVKFAPNMPVSINLTVPDVPLRYLDRDYMEFCGDSIVPVMGSLSAQAYMFESIEGYVKNSELIFDATITGRGSFTFKGMEIAE